jgi:nucleoside-diphosphate-sugar epimerase
LVEPLGDYLSQEDSAGAKTGHDELIWTADQLVLTIPPGRKKSLEQTSSSPYAAAVLSAILAYRRNQPAGRIIFTSSIGVYGSEHGRAIDRDTRIPIAQPTARQATLLLAESQVQTQSQRPYRILRLGGLYGGTRDPKKWFAGKEIPRPNDPVNLIHLDQVIAEIHGLLNEPFWTGTSLYNLVDEAHPSRGEFYG